MAFTRRDWTFPGPGLRGELCFVHRSDLAAAELDAGLAPAREVEAQLDSALTPGARGDGSGRRVAIQILADCGHARVDLARVPLAILRSLLAELIKRGTIVALAAAPRPSARGGEGGAATPAPSPPETTRAPPPRPLRRTRRVVSVGWRTDQAWCSDTATVDGHTESYADDESIEVGLDQREGARHQSVAATVSGDAFRAEWTIKEVLPVRQGEHLAPCLHMDAHAGGRTSPRPLTIHFITHLDKVAHTSGRTHFTLSLTDDDVLIEGQIKYVRGWGGQVVYLHDKVGAGTGGLLDGQLTWPGYRWMKQLDGHAKFWDGEAWNDLPHGFVLAEDNHFAVGFYQHGSRFVCQYGGSWPDPFPHWAVDAAEPRATIENWEHDIHATWTGKFDLKRKECRSRDQRCCRYAMRASVTFSKQPRFAPGVLIVADGNIRSNDALLFLGEPRVAVAAHEFGHRLGNRDEYPSAGADPALNSDGAINGIDPDSIMGRNLTTVKARHFREICKVFTGAVADAFGKSYNYLVVPS